MRHLLLLLLLLSSGSVFGITGAVILVSDNAADSAVAAAVEEAGGANVTVIKTTWGEFDANVASQVQAAASATGEVTIIGGPAAVVADYEEQLADYNITRLSGDTRMETSAAVLEHFESVFAGRKIIVVYGGDEEGIQEALQKAKAEKGMVLFVGEEDVSPEIEEALNEANVSEIEAVLSPNVNETNIKAKIENRTRARIKEIVRGNATEKAARMIAKAEQRIADMDRALDEVNVTKTALAKLSNGAHEKLEEAKLAFIEANYGRAFGHAVAANSMAENVLRMAKKLHSLEERGAGREVVKARIVARYKNLLRTALRLDKVIELEKVTLPEEGRVLLLEIREELRLSRLAMEAGEFGGAINHIERAEQGIARLKVLLVKRKVDEKRIRRSPASVTDEEVAGEESKDLGKRR